MIIAKGAQRARRYDGSRRRLDTGTSDYCFSSGKFHRTHRRAEESSCSPYGFPSHHLAEQTVSAMSSFDVVDGARSRQRAPIG